MIKTFAMQSRERSLPSNVKVHMRMDERSGLYVTNQVNGEKYIPSSVGTGGSLAFSVDNAVTIEGNTENIATPINWDVTLQTDKVCLLAAVVTNLTDDGTGTRVALGTANTNNVLTNSTQGGLHGFFRDPVSGEGAAISITGGYLFYDNTEAHVHYALWNGLTGDFTVKVLNLDGTVHNNGSVDLTRTTTGSFTVPTITLGNTSRLDNGHYYGMTCWELEHLPQNLDLKLALIGNRAVNGDKGAVDLR